MRILLVYEGRISLSQLAKYFKYLVSHEVEITNNERQYGKIIRDYRPEIVIAGSCVTGGDVENYYNIKIRSSGSDAYLIVIEDNCVSAAIKDNRIASKVCIIRAGNGDESLLTVLDKLSLTGDLTFAPRKPDLEELTTAENRIISQIMAGKCNEEIATSLRISVNTVKNHRKNIKSKLGIRGGKTALLEYLSLLY